MRPPAAAVSEPLGDAAALPPAPPEDEASSLGADASRDVAAPWPAASSEAGRRSGRGEHDEVITRGSWHEDAWVVAVTGHRPGRLTHEHFEQAAWQAARLLDLLRDAAADQGVAGLVLCSALAEGADRRLAHLALERGFALHAVLPFRRANYRRDFMTSASRAEFEALLARAERVTELPGRRRDEPQAYRDAGLAMLGQADVLFALWDGAPGAGRGGTADIVDEAWRRHLPVLHLGGGATAAPRLLWRLDGGGRTPPGLLGALRARTMAATGPAMPAARGA